MDRWGNLNMQQKAQLLGIYASKGYTDLASIINHYNTFQAGGKLTFNEWKSQMQSKYPDIEMDNTKAGYDYVRYFNDNYDDAVRQLSNLQHFPDTYKLPNHPTFSNESIYSRGPMMGGNWVNDSTFYPSIINRQQYPNIYKKDRPYTEREIYSNNYQKGGFVDNKSDWAKTHELELALQQLGWGNPDNRLHSDYAAKDDKGYYAGYNLKPVTVSAKHPIKDIEPDIKTDRRYWNDLYQQYLRREEAGKNYMKWTAPLAMSPLIPIAGPTVMNIMSNPLVDATFTADAVRNLPTALGDIRDNFNEGKIGRGLLRTGETALDLWGAGKLGKTFNKAWQKAFNLNTNLGITNNIIPITRPISKNPILNYNPESLPSELEHPFFLAHTLTGKGLAKALKEGSPAPSIGIIRGNNGKPSFTYPIYADDGIYTFYFKPDYLNSKEYVATPFDMFSPTIDNAKTYIGRELSPTEVVNAKRDMYNRWGTLNDLQNTVNFSSKLIENQKQFDKAVRKSQQFKSLQDVKNKMVLGSNEVYGEMMPLDLIDLEKAALVIGGGSKNSDIANFLTNMNFYELYKPHKIDNFYDIPGLAFQKGGKLGKVTPYGHLFQDGGPVNPKKTPKFKQSEEQYYDSDNDIIYAQDSIGEGYQHEYFHARPNTTLLNSLRPYYENLNDNRLIELGADLPFVKRFENDPNHFYSPEEIGARVSAARYMLEKAGVKNIDAEFLKNARLNELKYGDNFRDLLHMYNDENLLNIFNGQYQKGGSLGKVTPYGQWEYPHQVTTIPSNNITMKGVDYPVIGVSDTGDTKYMLPNMDYLFDGNYVTEYPLNHK